MKRPSFQFYPGDWQSDLKLRRCSPAARGVWLDILCAFHDSDDGYGLLKWPLKEIAATVGASLSHVKELVEKGVLRGSDSDAIAPLIHTPRSGRKDGTPVVLIEAQPGPIWYSKRFVKDEYIRTIRGESSRFGTDDGDDTKPPPKPPLGDGTTSPSPTSPTGKKTSSARPTIPCPYESIVAAYHEKLPTLPRVKLIDGKERQAAMRKIWGWVLRSTKSNGTRRATTADEALKWLTEYFDRANANDFLMGRTTYKSPEHENWKCDFDFLISEKGMKQVIEKTVDAA